MVCCAGTARTQMGSSQITSAQLDGIFAALNSGRAPGAAVLVVYDGRTVFRRGYGVTDLHTLHPIDAKTNFRLASFSKQFTAAAIMLLVRDGKLHYDDRLTDIFPEFPAYGKSITLRNLLNHTSGLEDYEELLMKQYPDTPPEKVPQILDAGVLKLLEQQTSGKFPPGSQWEYSNSGYAVLAMVVEKASGESFGQFLQQRIFVPLKMNHTLAYENGKNQVPYRAYGHSWVADAKAAGDTTAENTTTAKKIEEKKIEENKIEKQTIEETTRDRWQPTDQSPTSAVLGDGGIYSSLDDLAKWDRALRNHTLLSQAEMQPALTPVQPTAGPARFAEGPSVSYGFGWFLDPYHGHKRMSHDGSTIGFLTTIQRFPDDKLTIVVLANRTDINPQELALKVADLYLRAQP